VVDLIIINIKEQLIVRVNYVIWVSKNRLYKMQKVFRRFLFYFTN